MIKPADITEQFRIALLAITLLCVIALNNREVTIFKPVPETQTAHQVKKSAAAERQTIVKQKVSLEATPSYAVLQLATFPDVLRVFFERPVFTAIIQYYFAFLAASFFKLFLVSSIQPNAP
jgi:hypothetical protein